MAWTDTQFEEPEIVKFAKLDQIGDDLEGIFAGTEERQNSFGKKEVHVKIKTGEGPDGEAVIESLRTNQRLLAQVASVRRGARMRIEYVEDRPNDGVDREGKPLSPTRLYRVQVDNGATAAKSQPVPSRAVSDDDIPF
jgi:hypothetical protein